MMELIDSTYNSILFAETSRRPTMSKNVGENAFLFEQLPFDINVTIVNLLDLSTLMSASSTCKRWQNNTEHVTNLDIPLTFKMRMRVYNPDRPTKVPEMVRAPIDWQRVDRVLSKINPAIVRRLTVHPELDKGGSVSKSFSEFITKMERLESLTVDSSFLALREVKQMSHLTELHVLGDLSHSASNNLHECLMAFKNLEKLSYSCGLATESSYAWSNTDAIKNLTWLKIYGLNSALMEIRNIGKLTRLKRLYLEEAYIEDESFVHLATLTNLEVLGLSKLKAEIPPSPMHMYMSFAMPPQIGNPNPISGLRHLTKLGNLTHLDLSEARVPRGEDEDDGNNINFEYDVAGLVKKHFTNLKSINISETELGKENEAKLQNIRGLEVIKNIWNLSALDLLLYEDKRSKMTDNVFSFADN